MLSAQRPDQRKAAWYRADDAYGRHGPGTVPTTPAPAATGLGAAGPAVTDGHPNGGGTWPGQPGSWQSPGPQPRSGSWPPWLPPAPSDGYPARPVSPGAPGGRGFRSRSRRRIRRRLLWGAAVAVACLVFRRAIAAVALSATLHFGGVNVHLPHVRFAWPWQAISAGTTTDTDLGPWVLQKIEGVSKPALGTANFTFVFTHKVSKNIGPWPCWYASTFYAVGHASATVDLNPGPSWWKPGTGHFRLRVLSRPSGSAPGHVTVTLDLPRIRVRRAAAAPVPRVSALHPGPAPRLPQGDPRPGDHPPADKERRGRGNANGPGLLHPSRGERVR